ncbi:YwiC-like family protein [Deinococcus radiophilus]|uniref:YwiC-like family protein n=1 Tax=Deinococcus radiophilus TaxID=32062 RepID=UPI0036159C81
MFPPASAAPAAQAVQTRPRRKVGAEWVPAAHGAWAMLLLPYLVGIMLRLAEGPLPAYIWPLLPTWLLGYFAYNALTLWLKSGGKPRYLRPLAVYTGAAAVFGGLTLWLRPELLNWAWSSHRCWVWGYGGRRNETTLHCWPVARRWLQPAWSARWWPPGHWSRP